MRDAGLLRGRKRIYISNFSGLGNRLEALVLASAIQDRYGHAIYLAWPEKESLTIAGTRAARMPLWQRMFSVKVRDFDEEGLDALEIVRVINLRATYGPRELQRRFLLPTAARLRPHPRIAAGIRNAFARFDARPAVAVHLRQGDFHVFGDQYDALAHRHPAPPLWWYEHVMQLYAQTFPDVYFVLGYSGSRKTVEQLKSKFDILSIPGEFAYGSLLPGHESDGHPVADLFAMACCTTLIATPTSNFSNWAANALGPRSHTVLPPPRMRREEPSLGVGSLWGSSILDWREAAESGRGVVPIADPSGLPRPTPPESDWLP
jgi:hypothetical protein